MKKIVLYLVFLILTVSFIGSQEIGEKAIEFTAKDMQGQIIKLSDFNDKVVLLDFWATWCPPCRREIPNLIEIKRIFSDKKFEIISVDGFERGSDDVAKKFVQDNKMNWIHIIDKKIGYEIAKQYQVQYIPTMYVIKNGKIVASGLRGEELKAELNKLLK